MITQVCVSAAERRDVSLSQEDRDKASAVPCECVSPSEPVCLVSCGLASLGTREILNSFGGVVWAGTQSCFSRGWMFDCATSHKDWFMAEL